MSALRVIPTRLWSPEALTSVNFLSLPSVHDHLDVNLEILPHLKGAFKTAHSGLFALNLDGAVPPSLSGNVCVKQLYFSGEGGVVKHYPVVIFQIVSHLVCALYTSCVNYVHCYTLYSIDALHVQYCSTFCTPC